MVRSMTTIGIWSSSVRMTLAARWRKAMAISTLLSLLVGIGTGLPLPRIMKMDFSRVQNMSQGEEGIGLLRLALLRRGQVGFDQALRAITAFEAMNCCRYCANWHSDGDD